MRSAGVILVGVAALLAIATSTTFVPVTTRYITTEVTTLDQDEPVMLVGIMCGLAKGDIINVTVMLLNNPRWHLNQGILQYYVVDAINKTETDALCTNGPLTKPSPFCSINSWPSEGDLYIKGKAGPVAAISFTVDVARTNEAFEKTSGKTPRPDAYKVDHHSSKISKGELQLKTVYLTQTITLNASHSLPWLNETHVRFSFCPTPAIGSWYTVTTTVIGTDDQSSWTQYICDKLPCEIGDPGNFVAHNGKQLPSNTVVTPSGKWEQLYALIVNWGGPYDPITDKFIGHFQFNAIAASKPPLGN